MALPGNGTVLAVSKEREHLYHLGRAADPAPDRTRSQTARHRHDRRVRQRARPRRRHGRIDQHHPAHPRHRARGGHRLRHPAHRRHLAARPLPLQGVALVGLSRAGRASRRRHPHDPGRVEARGVAPSQVPDRHGQDDRAKHRRVGRPLAEVRGRRARHPGVGLRGARARPGRSPGPGARTASGGLAPKPMLFFPGDDRAVALWRVASGVQLGRHRGAARRVHGSGDPRRRGGGDLPRARGARQYLEGVRTSSDGIPARGAGHVPRRARR